MTTTWTATRAAGQITYRAEQGNVTLVVQEGNGWEYRILTDGRPVAGFEWFATAEDAKAAAIDAARP